LINKEAGRELSWAGSKTNVYAADTFCIIPSMLIKSNYETWFVDGSKLLTSQGQNACNAFAALIIQKNSVLILGRDTFDKKVL